MALQILFSIHSKHFQAMYNQFGLCEALVPCHVVLARGTGGDLLRPCVAARNERQATPHRKLHASFVEARHVCNYPLQEEQ